MSNPVSDATALGCGCLVFMAAIVFKVAVIVATVAIAYYTWQWLGG